MSSIRSLNRDTALKAVNEIQHAAEHAIQQAFREKTQEKMLAVYEAGYRQCMRDHKISNE